MSNQVGQYQYAKPVRRIRSGNRSSGSSSCGSLVSSLLVIGVLAGAGVYLFAFDGLAQLQALLGFGPTSSTRAPTASPVPTVPTLKPTPLPTTVRPTPYVEVIFTVPGTSPTVQAAFTNAAAKWSSVLSGNNVVGVGYTSQSFNSFGCSLTNNANIPDGTHDNLFIAAEIAFIDGAGGVLGQAGPCNRYTSTSSSPSVLVPVVGRMVFDSADMTSLESAGTLEDVILHEMGHVLGIGTLWDTTDPPVIPDPLIVNPIFVDFPSDVRPANDPEYQGHAAQAEYFTLAASTANIPVEDGSFQGLTPAQLTSGIGQGSVDGHWRETVFDTELMTPAIDSGVANPLSIMSVRALEDLGYAVDPSHADAYSMPGPSVGAAKKSSTKKFYMSDDIFIPEGMKEAYEEAKRDHERRLARLGGSI